MKETMEFQRKLNYEVPLSQSDINYYLIDTLQYKPKQISEAAYTHLYEDIILAAKDEVSQKFDVKFSEYTPNMQFENQRINYFLIGLVDPTLIDDSFRQLLSRLVSAPNSRVNIAMIYDAENAKPASKIILDLDKSLGVNTIFQDTEVLVDNQTYITISKIDAADNMVCETFRVKYKAIKVDDERTQQMLREARAEVWQKIEAMQKIYTQHKLWHRSPIDGAFMFRTKHGWLTTATHTPKNHVEKSDMSLILGFDEANDTIAYAGDRLPSSDLPEFLVLVERNEQELAKRGEKTPVIEYMAHFHKNEITRNPKFKDYAVPFSRYGVFESGHKFADDLFKNNNAASGINISGKGRGFIILEHGLVRMGVKLNHLEKFLGEFEV